MLWRELNLSDLLLMYINQFQEQQHKVTFWMLAEEMGLYSSKIISIHMGLFIMKKSDKPKHFKEQHYHKKNTVTYLVEI